MKTKICRVCKEEFPATLENFQYAKTNRDKLRNDCINCRKEYLKKYHQKNKDATANHRKTYFKKYYEINRDYVLKKNQEYYESHKDEYKATKKKWRSKNIHKDRFYSHKRRANKKEVPATLTTEQWDGIKDSFNNCCAYCGKEEPLQQEHFIPLSKGGEYTLNNIIPSCKSCNSRKKDKDFFDWYINDKSYSYKREKKILKYLNYESNKTQQLSIL